MIFNSVSFLIFFNLFFVIYWLISQKCRIKARNIFIILSSYFFYGFWDWRFLILIIISSSVDYYIGKSIYKSTNKKALLFASIIVNLGTLGFFKYFNFFIDSFSQLVEMFGFGLNVSTLNILLPVGISFYTFQTLSYTIDLYKNKITPAKDIFSFFAFVSFFPQLVAGPIERASHLLKQFETEKSFSYKNSIDGLRLILWGFFKKIVIADNFGFFVDHIFNAESTMSGLTILIGSVFFALQIYADFSGYSDIAIGLSKTLGFDLRINFRTPYFANSFRDFWKRWHISLSSWFRDYVYIPLGGNRCSNTRVCLNLFVTFLLSGLWHGANITFLIWGALHGTMLIIEKQFSTKKRNSSFYAPIVLILVVVFWIPFRAESFSHLKELTLSILNIPSYSFNEIKLFINEFSSIRFVCLIIVVTTFLSIEYKLKADSFNVWLEQKNKLSRMFFYYSIIFVILLLGNFSVKPSFIYFQF